MKIEIFGWDILKKHFSEIPFSKKKLQKILKKQLPLDNLSINIIFTTNDHIQELNKNFRKKDTPTDVLSFVIQEEPLQGEIYISPEYISQKYGVEEVLRVLVHGFLHITGSDHTTSFDEEEYSKEEMFVKQENILQNIQYEINNRIRKPRKKIS